MRWRVLVSAPQMQKEIDDYLEKLESEGIKIEKVNVEQKLSEKELINIISKYDGVIAGDDEFTHKVFEKAKKLKVISKWGVGIDSIDLDAARKFNVSVFNSPGAFKHSVADFVMGLILCLAREIPKINREMKEGNWKRIEGLLLKGKTLGVIGVGNIGKEVLRRGKSFGMNLIGNDIKEVDQDFIERLGVEMMPLEDLLSRADFVSINCDLNPSSRKLIGKREFSLMKSSAFLVNTARGPIVDQQALIDALEKNIIKGAALDVFEEEPLPKDSPLRKLDICILSPHNAYWGEEEVQEVHDKTVENLIKGLKKAKK